MKIAHVAVGSVPVLHRFGGAVQRRIVEVAESQAAAGHDVSIYSVGDKNETITRAGVSLCYLKCISHTAAKRLSRIAWVELQMRAIAAATAVQADVLHFHNQPEGGFLSRRSRAIKVLSYDYFLFHGGRRSPLYPVYRQMLKQFDVLLPVSEYCLQESKTYWRLPDDRLEVVYNGVNVVQFQPDPSAQSAEKTTLGISGKVLLYVGRVCTQKGTDLLLDAFKQLRTRRHDIELVIAGPIGQFGNSEDPQGWKERIAAAGGTYLGAVPEERLASIYNLADVFVMPTREYEMFGMAAVEAQACGKPVVASDHGGLRETVPLECGGRFENGNGADLVEKLERLLDDDGAYRGASQKALENAHRFEWKRISDRLRHIYQKG